MIRITLTVLLTLSASHGFTKGQTVKKLLVEKEAKRWTDCYSLMSALCFTETTYRTVTGDDGKSRGLMQIQPGTARWLGTVVLSLRWLTKLSDITIEAILDNNDAVSVEIACKLFEYYRGHYGIIEAVIRYNGYYTRNAAGKQVKNVAYWRRVKSNMELIR